MARTLGNDRAAYRVSDGRLPVGSTLGSPKVAAVIKATGALAKLYSCEAGADAFRTVLIRHWDSRSGVELQVRKGHFIIVPERQEHIVEYSQRISSRERIFVLNRAVYYDVSLRNDGNEPTEIRTDAIINLASRYGEPVAARFDDPLNAFIVHGEDRREFVRIVSVTKAAVSHDLSGGHIGIFHFEHKLEPAESADFTIVLTFSLDGEESARENLLLSPPCADALERTQEYYQSFLDRAAVMTPDPEINRGVVWAKTNMARSMLRTQQGWCLVNDPTETTHAVARDTAWFALGADYIAPWFAAESLRWFLEHLTVDGMVVEWFDTATGATETYGLDMNDDTPLVLWAIWHHFCVTGDDDFLRSGYPSVLRAAHYIVSKRGEHGLVWCHAPGEGGGSGVVGWRNSMQSRRLSGATTEINCECYAAMQAVSLIAAQLGDDSTAETFDRHAQELRAAINAHLLDRSRNLYYLAIDERGHARDDITSDLVFPILFGVAEPEIAAKIIETLTQPEFWSDAGLRSLPRDAVDYTPEHGSGLLGGVWAGPTFWFATAAASLHPELLAEVLTSTFRHYAADPLRFNTVPGQFCEWLHGETLINQGMMLSPWFAPKYLWAAVEAARYLPPSWSWVAARKVMTRGCDVSWFSVRMDGVKTYSTARRVLEADSQYEEDITDDVTLRGDEAICIALRREGTAVVFIGNTSERSIATSLAFTHARLLHRASLRVYDSVASRWSDFSLLNVDSDSWIVHVGRKGFSILEFVQESS